MRDSLKACSGAKAVAHKMRSYREVRNISAGLHTFNE